MFCGKCGATVSEGNTFCVTCGTPIPVPSSVTTSSPGPGGTVTAPVAPAPAAVGHEPAKAGGLSKRNISPKVAAIVILGTLGSCAMCFKVLKGSDSTPASSVPASAWDSTIDTLRAVPDGQLDMIASLCTSLEANAVAIPADQASRCRAARAKAPSAPAPVSAPAFDARAYLTARLSGSPCHQQCILDNLSKADLIASHKVKWWEPDNAGVAACEKMLQGAPPERCAAGVVESVGRLTSTWLSTKDDIDRLLPPSDGAAAAIPAAAPAPVPAAEVSPDARAAFRSEFGCDKVSFAKREARCEIDGTFQANTQGIARSRHIPFEIYAKSYVMQKLLFEDNMKRFLEANHLEKGTVVLYAKTVSEDKFGKVVGRSDEELAHATVTLETLKNVNFTRAAEIANSGETEFVQWASALVE